MTSVAILAEWLSISDEDTDYFCQMDVRMSVLFNDMFMYMW
jgi:hypothetical protein